MLAYRADRLPVDAQKAANTTISTAPRSASCPMMTSAGQRGRVVLCLKQQQRPARRSPAHTPQAAHPTALLIGCRPRRTCNPACRAPGAHLSALTKRSVMTPKAGMPCRSAVMESCRLHDEQLPQSPTPVTTLANFLISSTTVGVGRARCSSTSCERRHRRRRIPRAASVEMGEVARGASFRWRLKPIVLPLSEAGRGAGWPRPTFFHCRIEHAKDHGLCSAGTFIL